MILSIDLNPVLKRRYTIDSIKEYAENSAKDVYYGPGGDGIELVYLLHGLNEDVLISGFLGGINGDFIHKNLLESSVPHNFLPIKDETTDNIILTYEDGRETVITSIKPRVTREELGGFFEIFNRALYNVDMICFTGSLPHNVPKDIFFDLISNANKLGRKTMLAVKGEELKLGIEATPYIVLLDKTELENLTNLSLDYEYEVIKTGLYILDKGIKYVIIDMGKKGSIVMTKEKVYRVDNPQIDFENYKVNYGYMLGGYAISIKREYDIEMMLKLGQACGIVNCLKHKDIVDMSDIKRIMGDIEVSTFNY